MALPTILEEWMFGCRPNHPLAGALTDTSRPMDWQRVEDLLHRLVMAQPLRLATKRREFRSLTSPDRYQDLLSELGVGAWLVDHGVAFEFGKTGGQPQPDLVLPDFGFGIEVTRRKRSPDADLRRAISKGVYSAIPGAERHEWKRSGKRIPTPVARVTGQPIAIRRRVLDDLSVEVEQAIRQGHQHVHGVVRPARDGYPAVVASIDLYGGRSGMPRIVHDERWLDLTIPMRDIEDLVLAALEDRRKSVQGSSMPTILLIDASQLSQLLWLRSLSTWADRLGMLLSPDHTFVGVGLTKLWQGPRLGLGVGPPATPETRDSVTRWADQMGMRLTTRNLPNRVPRKGDAE